MSEPHPSLIGRLGALALDKMPTRFGSLLSHGHSSRPLSACERLPNEVLEEIFRLHFQDVIANLRVRMKIFTKLALLQLDGTDPVAVAYFDAKHGPGHIYLPHVQSIILAEVHDVQGAFVRFSEILSQMQQERANAGAPAVPSSTFGSPLLPSTQVDRTIVAALTACPKLAELTAKENVEVLLLKMISQFDLVTLWPRLRYIDLGWLEALDKIVPVLAYLSRFPGLEVVYLLISPENEQSGRQLPALEAIKPVQKLKKFSCQTYRDLPVLYDLVAPLIQNKANLTDLRWLGHLPRDFCRKLAQRLETVGKLVLAFMEPERDLAQSLIPQLPNLRTVQIQTLELGVIPNSPLLNQTPGCMPYATSLLDRLPPNVQVVDATCEVMNMATAFARNARLAAILARPASHALELDNAGHLVPAPGEKQPLQIVYLNADGHPPTRYAFVRFGSAWDYTEWSHVEIPSTGQQWKM